MPYIKINNLLLERIIANIALLIMLKNIMLL